MSRDIDSALVTESKKPSVAACAAVKIEFDSGDLLLNASPYNLTIGGDVYLGVGKLGAISGVEEGDQLQDYLVSLRLSGVPTQGDYIAIALAENYQDRPVSIHKVYLDSDHAAIGSLVLWRGRLDTMDIEIGQSATILCTARSLLADWDNPRIRRYTHQDQQDRYADDVGLEFVPRQENAELIWGRS